MNSNDQGLIALHESLKQSRVKNLKPKFNLHSYTNADGKSQIIMVLRNAGKRKQIPMDLYAKKSEWDKKKQLLKPSAPYAEEYNLILAQAIARITNIRIHYKLSDQFLSLEKLVEEYKNATPNYDFIAFMNHHIGKMVVAKGTLKNNLKEVKKLKEYRNEVPFPEITLDFLDDYKYWLATEKDNKANTIAGSMKIIKKFLIKANKSGIRLNLDLDDFSPGIISGYRVNLNFEEVAKLESYYNSDFIRDAHKLPLGYFLFSCYTGLRFSDVMKLNRDDFQSNTFSFISTKTDKNQTIPLSKAAKRIIKNFDQLFIKKISNQKTNVFLKEIAKICGIKKKLHFHISRHTFATNFVRKGGKVEDLQVLLGHSEIKTTMIYVKLVRAENIDLSMFD